IILKKYFGKSVRTTSDNVYYQKQNKGTRKFRKCKKRGRKKRKKGGAFQQAVHNAKQTLFSMVNG
ncbi:MAG: hypothetical protein LBF90_07360, partial [Prevotellaceae bacterium]|nr:hypothetical protein [Prevotellaceae bacterium]